MCSTPSNSDGESQALFRDELIAAGLLVPSGAPGVYGRGGTFEDVVERFEALVTAAGRADHPEVVRFPPLLPRLHYEKTGHLESFPNLLGSVHSFSGDDRDHQSLLRAAQQQGDWAAGLTPTDLVLIPAACYPLYPTATGTLPDGGRLVDLRSFVFRNEPSLDIDRWQCFRQREYVRIGSAAEARAHRDRWMEEGIEVLRSVGIDADLVPANDPFFGRGGRLMAATQQEQSLKYEMTFPILSASKPTAIVSTNYHVDQFGRGFDITTSDGEVAHTACIGFGLERIALALFKAHGTNPANWPRSVRGVLGL